MDKIKGLLIKVGEKPETVEIDNTLQELQGIVGGYIETLFLKQDRSIVMILNEEGKLEGLEPNIDFRNDVVVGNVIVLGTDIENGEFRSLTEEEDLEVRVFLESLLIR
ncbi:DUF3846 domain-containing protein [Priestia aryabhattai]|uniref:DUF3846 domain-containing protein n=1 Tax=Priestia aryabhattai TaxID=412384 RepID=UPI0028829409|nr:DUF3846 domain-containing protein [Priestia aryabhattai]MDT0149994.1 DUF3846 domain-containing protein [Priestia aryabhattai]MDT0155564.1 DUF3846 domain-containing protein [Priestia aryabhattai]